jgi:hypothetical protein
MPAFWHYGGLHARFPVLTRDNRLGMWHKNALQSVSAGCLAERKGWQPYPIDRLTGMVRSAVFPSLSCDALSSRGRTLRLHPSVSAVPDDFPEA